MRRSGFPLVFLQPVEILLVICGAGPLKDVSKLIDQVLHRGWKVQAIATPSALDIGFDAVAVELQTGRPVVTSAAIPRMATPDAILVAPATANTIAKLALGIRDTYAAAVLAQAVAAQIPVVILPSIEKVDLDGRVLPTHVKNFGIDQTRHLHTFGPPAHSAYRRHIRGCSRYIPRMCCLGADGQHIVCAAASVQFWHIHAIN
jgi:flavoprotein